MIRMSASMPTEAALEECSNKGLLTPKPELGKSSIQFQLWMECKQPSPLQSRDLAAESVQAGRSHQGRSAAPILSPNSPTTEVTQEVRERGQHVSPLGFPPHVNIKTDKGDLFALCLYHVQNKPWVFAEFAVDSGSVGQGAQAMNSHSVVPNSL